MTEYPVPEPRWHDGLQGRFLRLAASGYVPARWFESGLPSLEARAARTGELHLEIVSHCWNYANMLFYQLSSLVMYPPTRIRITMTVFFNEADTETRALLSHFAGKHVPGVTWNFRQLPTQALFRRAIGRNLAAKESQADWIWFTDCDLLFRDGCLDALNSALQARRDALVYPREEHCTGLLSSDHPLLQPDMAHIETRDIDSSLFRRFEKSRATGPLQITHGDVARAVGYCEALAYYQRPSHTWCKAYEDRAFRWLLQTQGEALDVPGVYRIRHAAKGRYTGSRLSNGVRGKLRQWVAKVKG